MRKIRLFDIDVDNLTMSETLDLISQNIKERKQIHHCVINAGKVVAMQHNVELFESVASADLINADGMGIVYASRFLGKTLKERVTGIDLMIHLLSICSREEYTAYFLGAKKEIVEAVVNTVRQNYGEQVVAGYRDGYFNPEEEDSIAQEINESNANILFVAITSPKKENFLHRHKDALKNVNFIMGVGGSFDVIAGKVKRAPVWMQNIGLEWFYRFIQEPGRMWKRYLVGNTQFIWLTVKRRFSA